MPGPLVQFGAQVMCSHGGQATATAPNPRVTLGGAPANGQYLCAGINVSGFAGSTQKVKLPEPMWGGKCQFTASADRPPRPSNITLKAGELNVIPWPAD